jgi:hypothetical protein
LIIANPDQIHDPPPGSALKVVSTGDGVAVFGSKPVEAGTYLYFLTRGNGRNSTPNPDDWYLVAASPASAPPTPASNVTITPVPTQPVLTNTANAAIGTFSGTIPLIYEDMVTLTPFINNLAGTIGRFGAGVATRIGSSLNLYGEYDYSTADKISEPWAVNFGFRWMW